MDEAQPVGVRGGIVEDEIALTTIELCRAGNASEAHIELWVGEGVLQPSGASPEEWRFSGQALRRVRVATRLSRDLDVNPPGVALVLDLLDEIEQLEARLRRLR